MSAKVAISVLSFIGTLSLLTMIASIMLAYLMSEIECLEKLNKKLVAFAILCSMTFVIICVIGLFKLLT
jgi:uncharacterized membrane protein